MCPGDLNVKDGTLSADNCLVKDSANLVLPDPGMPDMIMMLLLPCGSPAFSFSARICV